MSPVVRAEPAPLPPLLLLLLFFFSLRLRKSSERDAATASRLRGAEEVSTTGARGIRVCFYRGGAAGPLWFPAPSERDGLPLFKEQAHENR